jgi:3-hydroxyacyl-CoA dehydrogenase
MHTSRPIVLLGAGVLGRRIACIFVAAGCNVRISDPSAHALEEAVKYIEAHKHEYAHHGTNGDSSSDSSSSSKAKANSTETLSGGGRRGGCCAVFASLEDAVRNAWLVIEAIPEQLDMKIETFGQLDRLTPTDCIFGTNSSSYKSSLMLSKLTSQQRKQQMLNIHFSMPPKIRTVELMTDGCTAPEVMSLVKTFLEDCAMLPVVVSVESTGYSMFPYSTPCLSLFCLLPVLFSVLFSVQFSVLSH